MVYQNYNFGSKFKELRRSKGISIEKVAKDITSKFHLSNWKNGKATLDITVFVKLLSRINIQPAEFF
ncbi:helix-turn-helix domain-containing protein [Lactobacillus helveticus]|uniref:Helix-turn-helix domain-containing protein n=1 Tax=Lactobacillus helveticus TaxID=1587 RepID=A0A6A7K2R8_LACHE|nr:helix-turn-helix transcriptional regulator [Lactobacillus helveticus]MPW14833.1 helix-turn-helix domain-containing protein [Lactobacillus helveticus]